MSYLLTTILQLCHAYIYILARVHLPVLGDYLNGENRYLGDIYQAGLSMMIWFDKTLLHSYEENTTAYRRPNKYQYII